MHETGTIRVKRCLAKQFSPPPPCTQGLEHLRYPEPLFRTVMYYRELLFQKPHAHCGKLRSTRLIDFTMGSPAWLLDHWLGFQVIFLCFELLSWLFGPPAARLPWNTKITLRTAPTSPDFNEASRKSKE